mmetsp:Transcript_23918/g.43256  ORF Transcript_23918/g.43256 Transcript_23918/m.43256 type:complete len:96 (-) Transcript_23918:2071-2358(-)
MLKGMDMDPWTAMQSGRSSARSAILANLHQTHASTATLHLRNIIVAFVTYGWLNRKNLSTAMSAVCVALVDRTHFATATSAACALTSVSTTLITA